MVKQNDKKRTLLPALVSIFSIYSFAFFYQIIINLSFIRSATERLRFKWWNGKVLNQIVQRWQNVIRKFCIRVYLNHFNCIYNFNLFNYTLLIYSILASKKELLPLDSNREAAINQLKNNASVFKQGID